MNDRWTRPSSLSLTREETTALDTMAKALGLSRTGLVREWIGQAVTSELGERTGVTFVLTLNGPRGQLPTANKAETAGTGQKATGQKVAPGEAVNTFFPPSQKKQAEQARGALQAEERRAREAAEKAARMDRAARTGALFGAKGND